MDAQRKAQRGARSAPPLVRFVGGLAMLWISFGLFCALLLVAIWNGERYDGRDEFLFWLGHALLLFAMSVCLAFTLTRGLQRLKEHCADSTYESRNRSDVGCPCLEIREPHT